MCHILWVRRGNFEPLHPHPNEFHGKELRSFLIQYHGYREHLTNQHEYQIDQKEREVTDHAGCIPLYVKRLLDDQDRFEDDIREMLTKISVNLQKRRMERGSVR